MSPEAASLTQSWIQDPNLGDLFVLHLGSKRMAETSLVDRLRPRAEQVQALAQLTWPPPEQLSIIYERTVQGKMPEPELTTLEDGRHLTPFLGSFGAVVDPADGPSDHPVRRYLFPDLNPDESLALDPGEQVLLSWDIYGRPSIITEESSGRQGMIRAPTEVTRGKVTLTNQRLVYVGTMKPPDDGRSNQSWKLALISPALNDLRAAIRETKQYRSKSDLRWCVHFRHEWINQLGHWHRPDAKKGLFAKAPPNTSILVSGFTLPWGLKVTSSVPYRLVEPGREAAVAAYWEAVRAICPDARSSEPESTTKRAYRTVSGGFGGKTEVRTVSQVTGTVPYSLPERL